MGYDKDDMKAITLCEIHSNPNITDSTELPAHRVEDQVTRIILFMSIPKILPQIITVPLLGILSDCTRRRKFILWIPSVGNTIYVACFIIDYYADVGNWILFLGYSAVGVCGGSEAFYSGAAAYISDLAPLHKRTLRLSYLECWAVLASTLVDFSVEFTLNNVDDIFMPIMWCLLTLSLVAFITSTEFVNEPYEPKKMECADFARTVKHGAMFCGCCGPRSSYVAMCLWSFLIYNFLVIGQRFTTELDLTALPLCFSYSTVAAFILTYGCIVIIGTIIGTRIIEASTGDLGLTMCGYFTTVLGYLWMAIGRNGLMTFTALVILLFQVLPFVTLRSMASKRVDWKYQATMYSIFHTGQVCFMLAGKWSFLKLYPITYDIYQVVYYFIAIGLMVIPFLLIIGMYMVAKDDPDELVLDDSQEQKKYHAQLLGGSVNSLVDGRSKDMP